MHINWSRRMGFPLILAALIGVVSAIFVLAAIKNSGPASAAEKEPNTDPRKGSVLVYNIGGMNGGTDVIKRCDGTTLMYIVGYGKAFAIHPGSPECKRG